MDEKQLHRTSLLMLLMISLIWGAGYLGVQGALDSGLPTPAILAGRFLLGAMLIGFIQRRELKAGQSLLRGALGGVMIYFGFYFQTLGQAQTGIAGAAFLTATNVVMIPFIHWAVSRVKPPNKVFVLSALTMLGVALLSYAPGENFSMGAGEGMLLLGAFLFAGHMVYLGYAVRKGDPGSITFWQLLSAGLVGVFFLVVQRPALTLEMVQKGSLSVLYIGIMATGLCYYLQAKAQKHVSPSQTGIVLSLEGVFGALFSILAGMEALKVSVLLGGALITLSVILMEIKPRRA